MAVEVTTNNEVIEIASSDEVIELAPVNLVIEIADIGTQGPAGKRGDISTRVAVSDSGDIDCSLYNSISLESECSIRIVGQIDGSRVRVHNKSAATCIVINSISGTANNNIYSLETFDMEYSSADEEWSI